MKVKLILIVLRFVVPLMGDVYSDCHGGKPCVKCDCMGDYSSRRDPEDPDNPDNKQYPRHRCTNYCTQSCCLCKR